MSTSVSPALPTRPGKAALRTGWTLCGLVTAFLLLDAVGKFVAQPEVVEACAALGFNGLGKVHTLGVLLLVSTLLYAVPRTAVLGAALVTAYLGGAVATHIRVGNPLFTHTLFGVYLGVLTWGGLYLRDPRLRALFPLRDRRASA